MDKSQVELLFKNWLKILSYLGAFIVLGCSIYVIWKIIREEGDIISVVAMGLISGYSILWLFNMIKFKIVFGPEHITKSGVISQNIPYEEIEKLNIRKGYIEILGRGFLERVSIGNLYTNFEDATKLLGSKIEASEDIQITGKEEYILQYLDLESA